MKTILVLAVTFLSLFSVAQTNVFLDFSPKIGGNDLVLNTVVQDLNGVDITISDFNYYISNVRIFHDGGQELSFLNTVYFIKPEDHGIYLGYFPVTTIDSIHFGVGVPKNLNHLDISQYSSEHPLSWQNPNMHWGWISGYAIMLCNGSGDSNNDGTPDAFFELHNFGDPSYTQVTLPVIPTLGENEISVVINCNVDEWLFDINPGIVGAVHGSFPVNLTIMNNVLTRSVFEMPGNASLAKLEMDGSLISFVENGHVIFSWKDLPDVDGFQLIDISGRIIENGKIIGSTNSTALSWEGTGSYFFYLLDSNGSAIKHIQVIR